MVEDEGILLSKRVQLLESELTGKLSKINETLELLRGQITKSPEEELHEEELPDDATPYEISEYIKKERVRILNEVDKRQEQKTKELSSVKENYSKKYGEMINTLKKEITPEVYTAMTDTKDITYNQVITGDPERDFYINYRNATESIASNSKKIKSVVYGKQSKVPNGVNIPGSIVSEKKSFDRSQLSTQEQDIARMFSDEELVSMGIN